MRAVGESTTREIREAALVLLCQVGDKSARKDLLADYDAQIERNKTWPNSFEARGNVLYRIGDYKEAIKDYLRALQLFKNDFKARTEETYIGLARSHAQLGKLKEAAQYLEAGPLSMKQLADLAKEPVFAKLAKDPKYKSVFKLE